MGEDSWFVVVITGLAAEGLNALKGRRRSDTSSGMNRRRDGGQEGGGEGRRGRRGGEGSSRAKGSGLFRAFDFRSLTRLEGRSQLLWICLSAGCPPTAILSTVSLLSAGLPSPRLHLGFPAQTALPP